jgi:hypothetical protein
MTACAVPYPDPRTIHGVNEEFLPYVDNYVAYKGSAISYDIPIQFSNLEHPKIGVCTIWTTGERQIQIDREAWTSLSDSERIGLIFHELGHCDLNRGHINTRHYYSGNHISGDVPDSFMYPYNFFSSHYIELFNYYVKELFDPYGYDKISITNLSSDCLKVIKN